MVTESLIQKINDFADSSVGQDYQRSLDIQTEANVPYDAWQPYVGDLEFMRSFTTDFLAKRAEWIDAHIDDVNGVDTVGIETSTYESEKGYDVLGRPVCPDVPGIQFRNGKKIYVKP